MRRNITAPQLNITDKWTARLQHPPFVIFPYSILNKNNTKEM